MTDPWSDKAREAGRATAVNLHGDYYEITLDNGMGFGLAVAYGVEPKPGDEITLWGGFGPTIQGVAVNGRVAFYRTAEEQAAFNRQQAEEAGRWLEEAAKRQAEAIAAAGALTEEQMRGAEVPRLESVEALAEYVTGLIERPHDYGTCVYAMSMAAVAAFNLVAGKLGVTGFQAGCADGDILRRTRRLKHGFRIIDYGDMLYPQYWDSERAPIFWAALKNDATRKRFADEAERLLAQSPGAAPEVAEHWRQLSDAVTEAERQRALYTYLPDGGHREQIGDRD